MGAPLQFIIDLIKGIPGIGLVIGYLENKNNAELKKLESDLREAYKQVENEKDPSKLADIVNRSER